MRNLVHSIGLAPSERDFGAVIDLCRAERIRINDLLSRRPVKKARVKKITTPRTRRVKKAVASSATIEMAAKLMGITVEEFHQRAKIGA